jgi:diadenosine tetraphosphate (Ap4A) HIT family hydrolase
MSADCFFCKVKEDSPGQKILESHNFFVRFDGFPVSEGHLEVVPKRHITSLFELGDCELLEMFDLLKKAKNMADERFGPDGYNVGVNEGKAAGRTIDHLHVHLIPRYANDVANPRGGIRNIIPGKGDYA